MGSGGICKCNIVWIKVFFVNKSHSPLAVLNRRDTWWKIDVSNYSSKSDTIGVKGLKVSLKNSHYLFSKIRNFSETPFWIKSLFLLFNEKIQITKFLPKIFFTYFDQSWPNSSRFVQNHEKKNLVKILWFEFFH